MVKMTRTYPTNLLPVITLLLVASLTQVSHAGYGFHSSWDPGTEVLTWEVYVESGSPPPFRDFHIETGDATDSDYELIDIPEGWQMETIWTDSVTRRAWICFFGESPRTTAIFRVRYIGGREVVHLSEWTLTDDGDIQPLTGVIAGEGGTGALAPWPVGPNSDVKVGVHVMDHASRTCSKEFPLITDCSDIVATCDGNDIDFFPVFYDLVEVQGLDYSVSWPGTYSCLFTSCSYLAIGDIVWPAGSVPVDDQTDWVAHAWHDCLYGPVVVPGWGWIYEPGPAAIRIVASTTDGYLRVTACMPEHTTWNVPVCNFAAGIAGASGEDPCESLRTSPSTWGSIKRMFK